MRKVGLVRVWSVVAVGAVLTGLAVPTRAATPRPVGDIRVLATIPYPGNPGGLAVDGHTLYVDTSAADFDRTFDGSASIFRYDLGSGQLLRNGTNPMVVPLALPVQNMGLAGIALDAAGRLYVADMNGRIVRVDPRTGAQNVYGTFPTATHTSLNHMPTFLAFTPDGDLYVGDAGAAAPFIWRIPPGGGTAQPWFVDPRLAGGWAGSVLGLAVDPSGQNLYFAVGYQQPSITIYRLPFTHPDAGHLQVFHQYTDFVVGPCPDPSELINCEAPQVAAGAGGIAFGASGNLYVVLLAKNQLSILRPEGSEAARFPDPQANAKAPVPMSAPFGLAFNGQGSLLVSNTGDYTVGSGPGHTTFPAGPGSPKSWAVFDIYVGDTGIALARPNIP